MQIDDILGVEAVGPRRRREAERDGHAGAKVEAA